VRRNGSWADRACRERDRLLATGFPSRLTTDCVRTREQFSTNRPLPPPLAGFVQEFFCKISQSAPIDGRSS
jgi:hypothetical protein